MRTLLRGLPTRPLVLLSLTLAGAMVALGVVVVSARRTFRTLETASARRQSAYQFLMALRLLRQHVGEARVGLTGYVLTRDSAYRATYLGGIAGFGTDTIALRELGGDQPPLRNTLTRLGRALAAYEAALAETARLAERRSFSASALERDLRGSRDFVLLEGVRSAFVALEEEQQRLLDAGARDVATAVRRSSTMITIVTALSLVLLLGAGGALTAQLAGRERALNALRRHEQQLSSIHDTVGDVLFDLSVEPDGGYRFASVNRAFGVVTGIPGDQVVGKRVEEVVPEPALTVVLGKYRQAIAEKRVMRWEETSIYPTGALTGEVSVAPVFDGAGHCTHLVGAVHDLTERMRAQAALRESEERFREMADHIKEAFFMVDLSTGRPLYVSPTWAEIWGRPTQDGYEPQIWFEAIHPDDRAAVRSGQASVAKGEAATNAFRVQRPDGSVRWVRGRSFPVRDAAGRVYRMAGAWEDITELRQVEERFLQSQKMEAVGRLAGGVAHDFNNLLTVILGQTEMTLSELAPNDPVTVALQEVREAAGRAAALTRQLLAFSRQQLVEPVVFSLNQAVADLEKLVRRLIGEDVEVVSRLSPDAGLVRADRSQFEQLLMNLVVNARDAMPKGGRLSLETANMTLDEEYARTRSEVGPGDYVMLAVSDNGTGMTEAVQARIFEPFFTTKEHGKGTGLGLATCFGIVKQAGGHLSVYSEVGVGSTFRVYLPRVRARLDTAQRVEPVDLPRGHETILLVEDDRSVRSVAARVLRGQGYTVLEAGDGDEAKRALESHGGTVHLLLTDVVLPVLGGREVAEQVQAARPGIAVLFASGYTDDVVLQHRLLEQNVALLHKPFTRESIARKVRDVLDGRPEPA